MSAVRGGNRPFQFRLAGGNTSSVATPTLSNRDGIGAQVLVVYQSGKKILIQNQAGEGFSSQNSATQSIGIPVGDSIARLEIRWPSGNNTTVVAPDESEICVISEITPAAN